MRSTFACFIYFILSVTSTFAADFSLYSDTSKVVCLEQATRRVDEAFALMKKHYYKKEEMNWDSLVSEAKTRISQSGNCEDAFETVNWCFRQMSERHSFIMPAATAAVYNNDTSVLKTKPSLSRLVGDISGELLADGTIGYLTIPWINTTDPAICRMIADSIQGLIEKLDKRGVQKWIIDLRKNTGGNCWPMIAGVGPLLGDGTCAYFVSADEKLPIIYRNGAAMQGRQLRCAVTNPYRTRIENKHIIVLTGPKTSSSGEIVALAFKGKEQTYLYGEPTAGFTTANASYPLSDKSLLVLTVCMEADRTGKIYDGKIFPDELISAEKKYQYEDPAKSAALMWLQMQ